MHPSDPARVPSPGLIYPATCGGFVYILSRLNDSCDVWWADGNANPTPLGLHTIAQFWELVA